MDNNHPSRIVAYRHHEASCRHHVDVRVHSTGRPAGRLVRTCHPYDAGDILLAATTTPSPSTPRACAVPEIINAVHAWRRRFSPHPPRLAVFYSGKEGEMGDYYPYVLCTSQTSCDGYLWIAWGYAAIPPRATLPPTAGAEPSPSPSRTSSRAPCLSVRPRDIDGRPLLSPGQGQLRCCRGATGRR